MEKFQNQDFLKIGWNDSDEIALKFNLKNWLPSARKLDNSKCELYLTQQT